MFVYKIANFFISNFPKGFVNIISNNFGSVFVVTQMLAGENIGTFNSFRFRTKIMKTRSIVI